MLLLGQLDSCLGRRPLREGKKEVNTLFNDTLNTFYLRLYGVRHMVKDHSHTMAFEGRKEGSKYFIQWHTQHILFTVIWHQTYGKGPLTYHGLCYTSRGALAVTRNSSMGPPWRIIPTTHHTMSECSYHGATSRSQNSEGCNTEPYRILFLKKGGGGVRGRG